jgi:hypothetical protein
MLKGAFDLGVASIRITQKFVPLGLLRAEHHPTGKQQDYAVPDHRRAPGLLYFEGNYEQIVCKQSLPRTPTKRCFSLPPAKVVPVPLRTRGRACSEFSLT